MQYKKHLPEVECPSPSDSPFALILYRLTQLEKKVDLLMPKFQQMSGAWEFAKILAAFLAGVIGTIAIAAPLLNHLK